MGAAELGAVRCAGDALTHSVESQVFEESDWSGTDKQARQGKSNPSTTGRELKKRAVMVIA